MPEPSSDKIINSQLTRLHEKIDDLMEMHQKLQQEVDRLSMGQLSKEAKTISEVKEAL
jgi:hypothetical protein